MQLTGTIQKGFQWHRNEEPQTLADSEVKRDSVWLDAVDVVLSYRWYEGIPYA